MTNKQLHLTFLALVVTAASAVVSTRAHQRGLGAVTYRPENGQTVNLYAQSYALVIGVSDYSAGWPDLPGVRKDVEAVSRALEAQGFQVIKVENPDSTLLEKSFKEFIDQYGRAVDCRLLFYFAGHGHTVRRSYGDEMGYIVPADAPLPTQNPGGFLSKAMDMQMMETYARRVEAKHALFVFDSCFSGALFSISRTLPEPIGYKTSLPVRQFITSGSAEERVPDRSVFREQFVAALEGEADRNNDGYVTGTELGMFLQDKVIIYSRGTQHPQYGTIRNPNLDKGDFVFQTTKASPQSSPIVAPTSDASVVVVEVAFWNSVQDSKDAEDFKEYLAKYPSGQFAGLARRRLAGLTTPLPRPTPATHVSPTPSANALKERAEELLRRAEYQEALGLASQALLLDPGDGVAVRLKASALWNLGEREKAKAEATKAIRLLANPSDATQYEARCGAMNFIDDNGRALADCTEAIRLDKTSARAYNGRGNAYQDMKEYDKAIADYTEAIRLDPLYPAPHSNRGNAYKNMGEYDKAIADYTEAIHLNPKFATAYNNRGLAYDEKKEYDRAIADYTEAIRFDPKDETAYNNRGVAYAGKGNYARAVADYTEAIRLDPAYRLAYSNRAIAYEKLGDNVRATADRGRAAELTKRQ